jgi:hypothetical protein
MSRDDELLRRSAEEHAGLLDAYEVEGPGLRVTVPAATVGGGGARAAVARAVRATYGAYCERWPVRGAPCVVVTCGGKRFEVGRKMSGFVVREVDESEDAKARANARNGG